MTAGSLTVSPRTFLLPKATASGPSLTAIIRNMKPTRSGVWVKKAPSPSACASRPCIECWPPCLSLRVLRCPSRGLCLLGAALRCALLVGLAMTDQEVLDQTRHWLEKAVIGLNLCPFAQAVYVKNQVRLVVSHARHADDLLEELDRELQLFMATL